MGRILSTTRLSAIVCARLPMYRLGIHRSDATMKLTHTQSSTASSRTTHTAAATASVMLAAHASLRVLLWIPPQSSSEERRLG